ncbi:hypothetical protein CEXT_698791 [Caerostris extrusa]|uniref:Uncharacterized protein n=1 Tax=Caerostris extrusa TaxID=172846 RepID=A0AAV4PUW8_CAEEX|nr:hypothetical protein CEXT_698791 [Caerostris extrusa]
MGESHSKIIHGMKLKLGKAHEPENRRCRLTMLKTDCSVEMCHVKILARTTLKKTAVGGEGEGGINQTKCSRHENDMKVSPESAAIR